ncbi:MAG: YifB family Mg chelatase-like AAA ATPase [Alphaproteobacteria bacterium]|nr:YifB family Mg chelatase-like AAA ATPase [Alphaproteobacteria bacterium]
MATTVASAALQGVNAVQVEVEVDLLRRLPAVCIVGLPASAVRESAERVRSAIEASGHEFPRKRVVINLAPADLRKEGTALDLPMALGILAAEGVVPENAVQTVLAAGELALDGRLRPIRGSLSLAMAARDAGRILVVPEDNAPQAAMVPGATVWGARSLAEVVDWLTAASDPRAIAEPVAPVADRVPDLADVRGQIVARRALEVAAAGAHHLLLVGPPGCGKSMLAQRLPSILPPLTFDEALECTQVHCAAGLLTGATMLGARPFRAPHHTVTVAGLVGSHSLRPGEVALAHHGVLFLDEAAEFRRSALEVLRQPLEDGEIRVTRAMGNVTWPARLTLVLASNPCPCGHLGSEQACVCSDAAVQAYRRKLSGPILDRIDLHVEMAAVPPGELLDGPRGESSAEVRARVVAARRRQAERGQTVPNAQLDAPGIEEHGAFDAEARDLLRRSAQRHGLSARSTTRIQKVARTLADLDASASVRFPHVVGALAFRPLAGIA